MELPFQSPLGKPRRQIRFRNLRNINPDTMTLDLQHLSAANFSSVNESVEYYNQSLNSLLDLHAPLKPIIQSLSHAQPLGTLTGKLRRMKTAGRVLERRLKASGLTVHRLAYHEHQKAYAQSLRDVQSQYYSSHHQQHNSLHHKPPPQTPSPLHSDSTEKQCSNFAAFFKTKVDTIRSLLSSLSAPPLTNSDFKF
ncbi:hypothetical protein F7725_016239 [Dissostichus mawsoni]|uniref:Uncharacterized protein n=1 Tax=Dissostichus mawsoni TaxID=36200 RepID=A0A7J5Z1I8_DISMA|nr:hypothetical protein F7725_016239 [Dissostichus mawsoni]